MDMKKILQALDSTEAKPVEGSNDMKKFLQAVSNEPAKVITEGTNPHKVALPVQMAMQHYAKPATPKKESLLKKYFAEAEEIVAEQEAIKKQRLQMYASKIASRVLMKEGWFDSAPKVDWNKRAKELFAKGLNEQQVTEQLRKEGCPVAQIPVYVQAGQMNEAPIDMTGDPNDPTVYGHEKANPMSLKGRIQQARNQLRDLANMAESNELVVWQDICAKAKGGMFMGLEQNLEQIRHGIAELAAKRRKGGVQSRGIDKDIAEDEENQPDAITVDVPLLIRLLEYAREDAKTDMDLHNVAEKLIAFSEQGDTLTMDNYDAIVGAQKALPAPGEQ